MRPHIRLGTRGSALALAQAQLIHDTLRQRRSNITSELVVIRTTGDNWAAQDAALPVDKGMFTKELEEALLRREIDVAVHSLKDLPVESHPQLELVAIPSREDARDVLVTKEPFSGWSALASGAVVATGSLRRSAQLKALRSDVKVVDIRGNIDTRLRKLRENDSWSGILLASAGINRLKPDLKGLHVYPLDFKEMLPAPGQGAIAIQGRKADSVTSMVVLCLHDFSTAESILAERAFLQAMGGGCRAPIGAYANHHAEGLCLEGVYYSEDGETVRRGQLVGDPERPEVVGKRLAEQLLRRD